MKWKALILVFLLWSGCGDNQSGTFQTIQTNSNQALKSLAQIVVDLNARFENVTDCAGFTQTLDELAGTKNCADSGTETTVILDSQCQDGPPLQASATLEITFEACRSPQGTFQDVLTLALLLTETELQTLLSANGLIFDSISLSFQDLSINVVNDNPPQCMGVLVAQGQPCGVANDCSFCPL